MEHEQGLLKDMLGAIGVPDSTTNRQQLEVLLQALELFDSRNRLRGDLWVEFGLENTGHNIQLKGQRIKALGSKPEYLAEALDDSLDAVNYSAFAVRHVRQLYPEKEIRVSEPTPAQAELWRREDPPEVHARPAPPPPEERFFRRACHCGHPFNWHDSRMPSLSQREVEESGRRGRCSAIQCPCAEYKEQP